MNELDYSEYENEPVLTKCLDLFDGLEQYPNYNIDLSELSIVILRNKNKPVVLNKVSIFNRTCFSLNNIGGTIYAPKNMIDIYASLTNWSVIIGRSYNKILPIEGSIYETQYANGAPIV